MALLWVAAVWSLLSIMTAVVVCPIIRAGGLGAVSHDSATEDG